MTEAQIEAIRESLREVSRKTRERDINKALLTYHRETRNRLRVRAIH